MPTTTRSKAKPKQADEPPIEQPTGAELVVADATSEQEVLAVVDRHDEAMIVQELQRRALRVMLYQFDLNGSMVTDLSYLGVNEAVRVMNDRRLWRVTVDRGSLVCESVNEDLGQGVEPCWQATVYAVNELSGYGQFGAYTQPKRYRLKDESKVQRAKRRGDVVDDQKRIADKFARSKAINKAQRNALRVHIPEAVRQTMIAQYQGDPERIRVIEAGAGAAELAQLPPPLTDERSREQVEKARGLFDELTTVNRLAVLPAQFHAYLTRAEHDHDRLDEFIAYLAETLERERKAAEVKA